MWSFQKEVFNTFHFKLYSLTKLDGTLQWQIYDILMKSNFLWKFVSFALMRRHSLDVFPILVFKQEKSERRERKTQKTQDCAFQSTRHNSELSRGFCVSNEWLEISQCKCHDPFVFLNRKGFIWYIYKRKWVYIDIVVHFIPYLFHLFLTSDQYVLSDDSFCYVYLILWHKCSCGLSFSFSFYQ